MAAPMHQNRVPGLKKRCSSADTGEYMMYNQNLTRGFPCLLAVSTYPLVIENTADREVWP